jgi:undecaprenyl-diphosphatase
MFRLRNVPHSFIHARRREVILIAGFTLVAGLILSFGLLAEEMLEGDTAAFDRLVLNALRSNGNLADPVGPVWLEEFARDVTALGSYAFLGFLSVTLVGYLLLTNRRGQAALVAAAVLGGMLISNLLKLAFNRPRPDLPTTVQVFTPSFPSGHATLSAIAFLTLGALLAQTHAAPRLRAYFAILAIFLTVMVGVSRVYLGVHYATDVLAGWCVGGAWALFCWILAQMLRQSSAAP